LGVLLMAIEIERKFLVANLDWREQVTGAGEIYAQGYLAATPDQTVRVRIAAGQGYLTVKGPSQGSSRLEFEYEIPLADAEAMLPLCAWPAISKYRYKVDYASLVWEVDEFLGANQGLILAEVELIDPNQTVTLPPWVGQEVTTDPRYFNAYLAKHPYQTWTEGRAT
jgi:CYTH domain-containing protein